MKDKRYLRTKEELEKEREDTFWKTIDELKEKNKDKYDYSLITRFYKSGEKLPIICKIHDKTFSQRLDHHIKGHEGCSLCQREEKRNKFIERSKKKYGDQYDYSQVIFNGEEKHPKVKLKCNHCGTEFIVSTSYHCGSRGKGGCPVCAIKDIREKALKVDWDDQKNIDKLRDLVEVQGKSFGEIGKEFGISGHQVGVISKKLGFKKKDLGLEEKNLIEEYINSGFTVSEIAKMMNFTSTNIYLKLKKYDIRLPEKEELQIDGNRVIDLIKKGVLLEDIASDQNISFNQLRFFIDKNKIKPIEIVTCEKKKYSPLLNYLVKEEFLSNNAGCRILGIGRSFSNSVNFNSDDDSITTLDEFKEYLLNNFSQEYLDEVLSRKELEDLKFTKGERLVFKFLKSFDIDFNNQVRCNELEGKFSSWSVIIDFIIDSYNGKVFWIEYNGIQHYEFVNHFYPSEYFFKAQLKRDQNIRDYCKDNNIVLIEVPYTLDTYEKVSEFLMKTIIEGVDPKTLIDYDKLYK